MLLLCHERILNNRQIWFSSCAIYIFSAANVNLYQVIIQLSLRDRRIAYLTLLERRNSNASFHPMFAIWKGVRVAKRRIIREKYLLPSRIGVFTKRLISVIVSVNTLFKSTLYTGELGLAPEMAQNRTVWKRRIASRATLMQPGQARSRWWIDVLSSKMIYLVLTR